jgi:hypothetical protein
MSTSSTATGVASSVRATTQPRSRIGSTELTTGTRGATQLDAIDIEGASVDFTSSHAQSTCR